MQKLWNRIVGRKQGALDALRPERPFYAIGDIHGRADLLSDLLASIEATEPDAQLVFVGDYIDRGPDSAEVIRQLFDLTNRPGREAICLMGNHEAMMLGFLDAPEKEGSRWMRNGGIDTFASFGINQARADMRGKALEALRNRLAMAMGAELMGWLRTRPASWQTGNVAAVHAGAHPETPIETQDRNTLIWGHRDFGQVARKDGIWVVHGHTVVAEPIVDGGRISIDTGAYATDRLTAARIDKGEVRFVST